MKLLLDMNLSPAWVPGLEAAGHDAVHWSAIGSARAPDREILGWALQNDYVVFTNDLDFGAILAATNADAPSVIQIRTQDITPAACLPLLLAVLAEQSGRLAEGALLTIDDRGPRVRLLPIHGR